MISRVRISTFAALAFGLLFSQPIVAQKDRTYQTGSLIPLKAQQVEADLFRIMFKDMAQCVYSNHPKTAIKLLENSDQISIEYLGLGFGPDDFGGEFSLSKCLGKATKDPQARAQFRFDPQLLRSALAEEAYLANYKEAITMPVGSEEVMSTRSFGLSGNIGPAQVKSALADCIVFNAPSQADSLLRANPASKEELKAIEALVPAISGCLFEGQAFSLTPQFARELVSDGLWSRSHYPVPDKTAPSDNASETSN